MYCPDMLRRLAILWVVLLLTACGGGGGGSTPVTTVIGSAIPGTNVLSIVSDSGPAGAAYQVNRLYTDVTVCHPGTGSCQTIDHVLVDTGSTGLRLLASEVSGLGLTKLTGSTGFPLLNCAQFVDTSFAWGPVAVANIALGNMTASNVPVQLVADPAYQSAVPSACSTGGTAITSVIGSGSGALGAKGILGIGHYLQDCGSSCITAGRGFYYACNDASCTTTVSSPAPLAKQLANPVAKFATDYNGLVVDLPTVPAAGATSVTGSIVFGVGTQANNQTTGRTLLQVGTANPYISAVLTIVNPVQSITNPTRIRSFLDTGSNGIFFDGLSPTCTVSSSFYCPASTTSLSATLTGTNSAPATAGFVVSTPTFASGTYVLPQLAGPMNSANIFDGGLPFFFGRRVFIGIEGMPTPLGTGPLYGL